MSNIYEHAVTKEGKTALVVNELSHLMVSALSVPDDKLPQIQSDVTFTHPLRLEYLVLHLEYITRSGAKNLGIETLQVITMLISRLARKTEPVLSVEGEQLPVVNLSPPDTAPSVN